jgi:hypothetical protein
MNNDTSVLHILTSLSRHTNLPYIFHLVSMKNLIL